MTTSNDSMQQFLRYPLVDGRVIVEIGVFQGKIVSAQVYPRDLEDVDALQYLRGAPMLDAVSQLVGSSPAAAIASVQFNGAVWLAWQMVFSTISRQAVIDLNNLHVADDAFESALLAGGWSTK